MFPTSQFLTLCFLTLPDDWHILCQSRHSLALYNSPRRVAPLQYVSSSSCRHPCPCPCLRMSITATLVPSPHSTRPLIGRLKSTKLSVEELNVPIPFFTLCTIGRSPSRCTTVVKHGFVGRSRRTFSLFWSTYSWIEGTVHIGIHSRKEADGSYAVYIMDNKTFSGTYVSNHEQFFLRLGAESFEKINHRLITTNTAYMVKDGDLITFGTGGPDGSMGELSRDRCYIRYSLTRSVQIYSICS